MDDSVLADLFSVAYEELRRVAASVRRRDPGGTLNPTALVNEAYLKLAGSLKLTPESRLHFKRIAARAMRQVLIEAARRRTAGKRGSGYAFVTFDDEIAAPAVGADSLLALDGALEELAQMNARQAQLVEYRFFGGFELPEIAQLMGVSKSTIMRDWRAARAWLSLQLRRSP
jgi:RNA polymerase sigma factor (TIGR02999 family)